MISVTTTVPGASVFVIEGVSVSVAVGVTGEAVGVGSPPAQAAAIKETPRLSGITGRRADRRNRRLRINAQFLGETVSRASDSIILTFRPTPLLRGLEREWIERAILNYQFLACAYDVS